MFHTLSHLLYRFVCTPLYLTPHLSLPKTQLSLQKVIKEMNRLGMMIDLSHASDTLVRRTLEVSRAPVIFSHSAARTVCDNLLNVPDDMLQLLVSGHLALTPEASSKGMLHLKILDPEQQKKAVGPGRSHTPLYPTVVNPPSSLKPKAKSVTPRTHKPIKGKSLPTPEARIECWPTRPSQHGRCAIRPEGLN